ncbi:MAG TPA: glycerate kinase [Streptosporangiaceae bacterium]
MGRPESSVAHVLLAPDKFKGSLSARDVASALASGMRRTGPGLSTDLCPVADGGDGTLEAALSAGFRRVPAEVEGPTGQRVTAAYAERDGVALVELAQAAGLSRLPGNHPAPLTASTYGVGQLAAAAIAAGNRTVVLAAGGSASSDGGAGLVQALGAELSGRTGEPLRRGGGALTGIARIDLRRMHERIGGVAFVLASDVTNPLLGRHGAAAVFGPQKGASPGDVAALERGLARWADAVAQATGVDAASRPGAGAAGGTGFGALALLGASVIGGADMVLEMVHFADRVRRASLVVTGEGTLDEQTRYGKAPARVAQAAHAAGVPTVAVAGRCTIGQDDLHALGIRRVYALQALEPDPAKSIANAAPLLERIGEQIAAGEPGGEWRPWT